MSSPRLTSRRALALTLSLILGLVLGLALVPAARAAGATNAAGAEAATIGS